MAGVREYHLGEEVSLYGDYVWIVTDYWYGDYEGGGTAVGLDEDGTLWELDLGHCSCYGPGENGRDQVPTSHYTGDSVFEGGDSSRLTLKVQELLAE